MRIEHGRVAAIAAHLDRSDTDVTDARGGLLIPGLHDHHLHLLAMAATRWSLDVSAAADGAAFDAAVRAASSTAAPTDSPFESPGWLRIVGYDERLGPLDRDRLDRLAPHRPVRVQHRSGAAWMLNGEAQRLTEPGPGIGPGLPR
ncbi:MAG: amidohydrolase family protein [Actinobacteria bacterium]|nr:amidohydrolase family protein [Actinomycetota bacterium]